ncbi:MAG: PLP-dependent cysteine synthase family protein [Planctomycetes bacterium]|jgi:cysteine synthase A|nr:PLP-dependent cysteine synthase family protein [Planctomycetota bacterium]
MTIHAPAPSRARTITAIRQLIGHTPLLEVLYRFDGRERRLYAKYESMNMTGSVKDRMACHILAEACANDLLREGYTIVEASSGNTGIAFAALGAALGHPVRIYMPDWMSRERVQLIGSLGAEIVPVSAAEGGFLGSVQAAERYAREHDGVFLPRQFENQANVRAHASTTGPEILLQLEAYGVRPAAFTAGVGTGGTVMGVGRALRSVFPKVRVHPLEPANSPTLRTGHKVGKHRIQGISDEFVPAVVDLDWLDAVIDVWDGDAILMAQALAKGLGLAVGISAGANFLGAVQLVEQLGAEGAVVTVFCDSNKKYLSTDLCRDEPVRDDYLAPRVELLGFRAVR